VDNGRQESAERYQASTRTAFHGKALAIVRSGTRPGTVRVTARADGLRADTATVHARRAASPATTPAPRFAPEHPAPVAHPHADASYSGRPDTLPAAVLDGDPATGWSNGFQKAATALLPAFDGARAEDWISVDHGRTRRFGRVEVSFTVDAAHSLPAAVEVAVWDGRAWRTAEGARIEWATASDAPTVITFEPVSGSRVRLTLTSRHPGEARGAVRVSRLEAPAV
jgi:beta-galactosidase